MTAGAVFGHQRHSEKETAKNNLDSQEKVACACAGVKPRFGPSIEAKTPLSQRMVLQHLAASLPIET